MVGIGGPQVSPKPRQGPPTGHLLTIGVVGRRTGADWLPTFEFGLANDSSCLKIL